MIDILVTDFVTVLFIFMRIFTAFTVSPIFGHKSIPIISQIALAFIISYMIFLGSNVPPVSEAISIWYIFMISIKEVITGFILGYSLHLVFWSISYAGTLIGFDIGLTMAEVFNPTEEISNNVLGEFLHIGAILVFFIINGHHYFIQAAASSFNLIPIGKFTVNGSAVQLLITYTAGVFVIAVKIAAPIMVSFFLIHLAEGIISRVIPQMPIFFVSQPLKIMLGLSLLSALVPIYIFVIKNLLKNYEDNLYNLIKVMGT